MNSQLTLNLDKKNVYNTVFGSRAYLEGARAGPFLEGAGEKKGPDLQH